jgi:predicted PurR-regulated permease PerM
MAERLRARARRGSAGADDGAGAVADERPSATVSTHSDTPRPPRPVEIPHGLAVAAAWSWRVLLIVAALAVLGWLVGFFAVLVLPIAIALLITALVIPAVDRLARVMSRGLATALVVLGVLGFVVGALTLVGQQIASGFADLADQVAEGLAEVENWLMTGPLDLNQSQLADGFARVREALSSGDTSIVQRVTEVGTTVGHVVAGFFLVLFSTYFFLYQGKDIWAWVVRLFPRGARRPTDGAGRAAWVSLTAFVRATVVVALVDAVGITIAALVLRVPLALPIGVLVFLSSFIPIVGATLSGAVAVLVALVAHGPLIALFMLAAVIVVQQLESHVLQPFLLGRAVRLHPLAVIFAIAAGALAAGIAGALVAVPLVATLNTAVSHLNKNDYSTPAPITSSAAVAPVGPGESTATPAVGTTASGISGGPAPGSTVPGSPAPPGTAPGSTAPGA